MIKARPYLREIQLKKDEIRDFTKYPYNIPAIRKLHKIKFYQDVTFLIGENGAGKSTLVEGIALTMDSGRKEERRMFNFLRRIPYPTSMSICVP